MTIIVQVWRLGGISGAVKHVRGSGHKDRFLDASESDVTLSTGQTPAVHYQGIQADFLHNS